MPHDESMPDLSRLAGTQTLPAQIHLSDRARASVPGVPGGVPPMFQLRNTQLSESRGSDHPAD